MKNALRSAPLVLLACVMLAAPPVVLGDDDNDGPRTRVVECSSGERIQRAVDRGSSERALTVVIRGTCTEDVTLRRDDLTIAGEGGTVSGTITILGARRVLIQRLTVTGPGAGVVATDNAALRIEDSFLDRNEMDGIIVRNGAQATLRRTSVSHNGQTTLPDQGRGIHVLHGGSVDASNSTILDNRSDGVGVFNNSYASLVETTIQGNGRRSAGEAGIQVNRSRVRANGNVITGNTGIAAVIVVNHSDYRTGSGLNAVDFPDNQFAFERIEHPVGEHEGQRLLALDLNNSSYGDLRQVEIVGSIAVGDQSMMQIRGDQVGTDRPCSTVDTTGGSFTVSGLFGLLRMRQVRLTAPTGITGGVRDISSACSPIP